MYDRFRETCHDGDGVALDLIVANKHRAGLEAAPWRAAVPRQPVQEPQVFPIKPAKGPLLQAISATFALAEAAVCAFGDALGPAQAQHTPLVQNLVVRPVSGIGVAKSLSGLEGAAHIVMLGWLPPSQEPS
jgi:hypothetical protein